MTLFPMIREKDGDVQIEAGLLEECVIGHGGLVGDGSAVCLGPVLAGR